jgi:hypothetical protein
MWNTPLDIYILTYLTLMRLHCAFLVRWKNKTLENTEQTIKIGQSGETGNIVYTRGRKTQHVLRSEFRVVMSVTISAWKRCSVRLYLQLLVGGTHLLFTLFVFFVYSGVQHVLLCCVFLPLVYTMLPVSLDCPILIVRSVFSNVFFSSHQKRAVESH